MSGNLVVFWCFGMGRPFASIAEGLDSGKPARSYLPVLQECSGDL
jgi:hypothetical protein